MKIKLPRKWTQPAPNLYDGPRNAFVVLHLDGWWAKFPGKTSVRSGPHSTAALAFRALGIEVEEEEESE